MSRPPHVEIERKFLVRSDAWRGGPPGITYRQGYICTDPQAVVRVRAGGGKGFVTLKGRKIGLTRAEFEYPVPSEDAEAMIDAFARGRVVRKTRYLVEHEGLTWEVDEYHDAHEGLVVAEVELTHEDQAVTLPSWVGRDVSDDPRYANSVLAQTAAERS